MTLVYSCSKMLVALDGKVTEYATESLSLRDSSFVGEDTPSEVFANSSKNGQRIWEINDQEDELMKMSIAYSSLFVQ